VTPKLQSYIKQRSAYTHTHTHAHTRTHTHNSRVSPTASACGGWCPYEWIRVGKGTRSCLGRHVRTNKRTDTHTVTCTDTQTHTHACTHAQTHARTGTQTHKHILLHEPYPVSARRFRNPFRRSSSHSPDGHHRSSCTRSHS